jgi:hypothetical protein
VRLSTPSRLRNAVAEHVSFVGGQRYVHSNRPIADTSRDEQNFTVRSPNASMKRHVAVLLIATFGATGAVRASDGVAPDSRAGSVIGTPSLVLTDQGRERHIGAASPEPAVAPIKWDFQQPTLPSGQHWLFGLATMIACNALQSGCARMPPAPTPLTPPGGESWRLNGCTSPNTCPAWMYPPP